MSVKSFSILFLVAFLLFSCKNEKNKHADSTIKTEEVFSTKGKLDLKNFDLKKFSYQDFYKTNKYENAHDYFANDSIEHQDIRLYNVDRFGLPKSMVEENPDFYFENYLYYEENKENTDVGENFEDIAKFEPIAYFENLYFDFASFVVNKKTNTTEVAIFSTIRYKEEQFYNKKVEQIIEKIGPPIHHKKVTNSNNGNNYNSNTWQINNSIYQLILNGGNENRIELLIIDKNSVPVFDKDYNIKFGILFNKKEEY